MFAKTARDTLSTEVTDKTTSVIKFGERVQVDCKEHWGGAVQCFDKENPGQMIQLDEKPVTEAWSPENSRVEKIARPAPGTAPGGKDWKLGCNILEKLLMDNCWSSAVRIAASSAVLGLALIAQ